MEINLLSLALATITGIVIGAIWFGPKTFFPIWWKFLGKSPSEQPGTSNMGVIFGTTFVAALVQALVLAVVINLAEGARGELGILGGAAVGALMGVGFAAASSVSHQLFGGFSIKAWILEVGQDIVSLAAMGAILASLS
jgi:hypothetical protein